MELKEILAISKLPGLYQIVASRDNGLIVTPLGEQKRKFVASRQHMFTPLENITVYTNTDSVELSGIFKSMKAGKLAMPDPKSEDKTLRAYFTELVPDHDQERVYVSDIRKMLKWFTALNAAGVFEEKKAAKEDSKKEPKSAAKKDAKKEPKEVAKKAKSSKEEPAKEVKKTVKKEAPEKAEKKSKK